MNKDKIRKLSYICNNDDRSKCSDKKWKKVKSKFVNKEPYDFKRRAENLLDIKKILDELEVPFFLTHGALLGAYRENDFIKHDDDIDLDIFEEIFLPNYDAICEKLINDGFVVRGRSLDHKGNPGEKINLYRYGEKINIRAIYIDPDFEQGQYRLTNVFQYPIRFHENPDTIDFKGATFITPGPIEEFIEFCFGEDWRIPVRKTKKEKHAGFKRGVRRIVQ